jgi:hypothetical protein
MSTMSRVSADVFCGLLLLAISAFSIWVNSDLEFGSSRDIGPGYFPVLISCALGLLSLLMILRGLVMQGDSVEALDIRPVVFVLASFIAFAVIISYKAGLIPAVLVQVLIAHFACRDARPVESLLIGVGLAGFSAVVFVLLLKMPVGLLP